jgi:hypothetical protein
MRIWRRIRDIDFHDDERISQEKNHEDLEVPIILVENVNPISTLEFHCIDSNMVFRYRVHA